ncbi:hypothetical protein Rsub_08551 [Raphidocelis subcapitata]|uniref:BRCT domain-containing protein n=1 Tax=Raphidocelis subcapitata TaxID=307507 RepID=A0A2V0PCF9_9CHLO|nr:hypothetical protein Rsub_08551 [Raphidocelis subcapitata]|eukprot:GBF95570.1 hypothetical protein Rsub_08551 [Raphidocelis subcapitata]
MEDLEAALADLSNRVEAPHDGRKRHEASRVVVCASGFHGAAKAQLQAQVAALGGAYRGDLVRGVTTHLVCRRLLDAFGSAKYRSALEWGVSVVGHAWLVDSLRAGRPLPAEAYKDDGEDQLAASPPPQQQQQQQWQEEVKKQHKTLIQQQREQKPQPLENGQPQQQRRQQQLQQQQQRQHHQQHGRMAWPLESQDIEIPDSQPFGTLPFESPPHGQRAGECDGSGSGSGSGGDVSFAFAAGGIEPSPAVTHGSPQWGWGGAAAPQQQQQQAEEQQSQEQGEPGDEPFADGAVPETQLDPFSDWGFPGGGHAHPALQYPLLRRSLPAEETGASGDCSGGSAEAAVCGPRAQAAQAAPAAAAPAPSTGAVGPAARRLKGGRLSRRVAQLLETPEDDLLADEGAGQADEGVLEDSDLDEEDLRQLESHRREQKRAASEARARERRRLRKAGGCAAASAAATPCGTLSRGGASGSGGSDGEDESGCTGGTLPPSSRGVHSVVASSAPTATADSDMMPCTRLFATDNDSQDRVSCGCGGGGGGNGDAPGDGDSADSGRGSACTSATAAARPVSAGPSSSCSTGSGGRRLQLPPSSRRVDRGTMEAVRERQRQLREQERGRLAAAATTAAAAAAAGAAAAAAVASPEAPAAAEGPQQQEDLPQEWNCQQQGAEEASSSGSDEERGAGRQAGGKSASGAQRPASATLSFITLRPLQRQPPQQRGRPPRRSATAGGGGDADGEGATASTATASCAGGALTLVTVAAFDAADDGDSCAASSSAAPRGAGGGDCDDDDGDGGDALQTALRRVLREQVRTHARGAGAAARFPPSPRQDAPTGEGDGATPPAAAPRGEALSELPTCGLSAGDEALRAQLGARLAHLVRGSGGGDDEEPIPLKLLQRPARGSSAREWHRLMPGGAGRAKLQYAEQIQIPWACATFCTKERSHCPIVVAPPELLPGAAAAPAAAAALGAVATLAEPGAGGGAQSEAVTCVVEPIAFYQLPSGGWWLEGHRLLSTRDLRAAARAARRAGAPARLRLPADYRADGEELLRSTAVVHVPVEHVKGVIKIARVRTRQAAAATAGAGAGGRARGGHWWRYDFDESSLCALPAGGAAAARGEREAVDGAA